MQFHHALAMAILVLLIPANVIADGRKEPFLSVVEKLRAHPHWYDEQTTYNEVKTLAERAGFDLVTETTLVRLSPSLLVTVLPSLIIVVPDGEAPTECTTAEEAFGYLK